MKNVVVIGFLQCQRVQEGLWSETPSFGLVQNEPSSFLQVNKRQVPWEDMQQLEPQEFREVSGLLYTGH